MNPSKHHRLRILGYGIVIILCGVAIVLLALHFTQSTSPQRPGISQSTPHKQTSSSSAGNSVIQTMGNSNSASSSTANASPTASTSTPTSNNQTSTNLTDTGPTNVMTIFIVTTIIATIAAYSRQIVRIRIT